MQPLFVTGVPRSGTTYLKTILNHHPDIFLTEESRVITWAYRVLGDQEVWEGTQILNAKKAVFRPILIEHLRAAISVYYSRVRKTPMGGYYWGDKMPCLGGRNYFDTIGQLYPGAKIICIHRDPRSVVASLMARGWADLHKATDLWRSLTQAALEYQEAFGPEKFLSVHYRDLLTPRDRLETTRRCLEFLGLKMADDLFNWLRLEESNPTFVSEPTDEIGANPIYKLLPVNNWYVVSQCKDLMASLGYKARKNAQSLDSA